MNETLNAKVFFTWDIHYRCNYNCTYCFLHFEPATANIETVDLAFEKWVTIWTDFYKKYGACHIAVTGGEPFTYPNFMNLVSELSTMHTFEFSTNLSWDVDYFVKHTDPQRVKINSSFHPEFIKAEKFLEKVLFLKEKKYSVSVTFVAYPLFMNKIKEYGRLFQKHEIKLILYPYRGPYLNKRYPEEYSIEERKILEEKGLSIGTTVNKDLLKIYDSRPKEKEKIEKKLCYMGKAYAKIIPNGEAFRCCAAVNKEWGSLGNLVKNTFELFDEARECPDLNNCRCYKAMIAGEENKWKSHWQPSNVSYLEGRLEKELSEAKLLRNENELQKAMDKVDKILKENTNNTKALTLLAEIYVQQKNYTESRRILEKALETSLNTENHGWIYRVLGRIYRELAVSASRELKEKIFSEAICYFKKAVKYAKDANNKTDEAHSYHEMAIVYYNLEKYSLAMENIKIALNHMPNNGYFKKFETEIAAKS